uniref:Poly(A) polymerase catalytic subunit domain-containing protein n=1 Tax=viral metagenome TaxID=1070528 RepID=A0A6C0I246_9ZZZZ
MDIDDKFKYIGQTHNVDNTKLNNLLEIIREFIIKKELIIYGGVAIDYALRLKGNKIYSDYEHPDFDVFSSNHTGDCHEIVDKLYAMGYRNVSAIRAKHPQTMRVRCDFLSILDISYVPKSVFEKLPILKYNGIAFIDPIYQRMDMHLSLCLPFSGFPENITWRWAKDIKRFNILNKYYPARIYLNKKIKLVGNKYNTPKMLKNNNMAIRSKFIKLEIDLSILPPFITNNRHESSLAIAGFGAYAIIRQSLEDVAELLNFKLKTTIPKLDIQFSKTKLILEIPDISPELNNIHFATYKYLEVIDLLKHEEHLTRYNAYLDINFEYIHFKNIIIASTEHLLLSALFINYFLNSGSDSGDKKGIYITSIQHLLLHFLFQFHITKYTIYIEYYIHTLNIISAAEQMFQAIYTKINNEEDKISLMKIFNNSPFAPVISTFGNSNIAISHIIQEGKKILEFHDEANIPDILGFKDINYKDAMNLPNNINTNKKEKDLSYLNNALFKRDGNKVKNAIKKTFFD